MEVKSGYKQTEIGIIPEDWNILSLNNVGRFKNGINKGKESFGHGSPFVNLIDIFGVSSVSSTSHLGLVDSSNDEQNMYSLKHGDVLFVRSSVKPSGVGLTAVVVNELHDTVYSGFLIRFRDNGFINIEYKKYCFHEEGFRSRLIGASSVSANTNINQDNLKRLEIPLPPTKLEQEAIAKVLSDTDALIESLEQLIVKKRNIKQGAMQTLFEPKKDWVESSLGSIATIIMGQSPSSQNYNIDGQGLPLIQGNADIKNRKTIIRSYTSEITKRCNSGDTIMSVRAPVGEVAKATSDACIGRGVCAIRYENEFLYHYLIFIESSWSKLSKGSTFDSVTSKEVKELELYTPSTKTEQEVIATVLSDMDKELEALETKLEKYRMIKQGMMDNLLTGKIRLI